MPKLYQIASRAAAPVCTFFVTGYSRETCVRDLTATVEHTRFRSYENTASREVDA